jgi:hypothetical protein
METPVTNEDFRTLANTHLANFMHEAKKKEIDPEKAVLGLFAAITTQIETKHGVEETRRMLNAFVSDYRSVRGK